MSTDSTRLTDLENELATRGTEPPKLAGRIRLDAARAVAAALALSTAPPQAPTVQPGDVVHGLDDRGLTVMRSRELFGGSIMLYRGDEIVVTQGMLDAAVDASGRPVGIAIAGNEPEQIAQWGRVRLGIGPAPEGLERWTHGSAEWREAREQARQAAWSEPDPDRRAAARAAVEARFGPAPVTSVTLSANADPSIKRAEEQRARLDALGVRHISHVEAREAGVDRR